LRSVAKSYKEMGVYVGPWGMSLDPTDWADGLSFLCLCVEANEEGEIEATGCVPEPPPVPEGAVI